MNDFIVRLWGLEVNWLAQAFGVVGLVLLVVGYQRPRKQFLLIMIISNMFNIVEYSLLGGWTAVIRCIISSIRNTIILLYLGKNKAFPVYWVIIFVTLTVAASAFFINVWYAVVPPVCSVAYTIFTCQKNYKLQKIGASGCDSLTIVYCLFLGAYISALRNLILIVSALVSLLILIKKEKKENKYKADCFVDKADNICDNGLSEIIDTNKEEVMQ